MLQVRFKILRATTRSHHCQIKISIKKLLTVGVGLWWFKTMSRTSLVVQWLGLCTFTAGDTVSIPGCGTEIPLVAQHGQIQTK